MCCVLLGLKLAKILYLITQHVHTTFKISTSFNSKNIPIEIFFIMKKRPKIHIMVCKILIDGVMVIKLGKIVYLFTQHIHTTFEIPTSFISLNIPVQMLFLYKKRWKFTLFWSVNYTSIELSIWNLACSCTLLPNMYLYTFKSQSHCIVKIPSIFWFCTIKTVINDRLLVCKIHILQLNGLKFSENVYSNKAHLKM